MIYSLFANATDDGVDDSEEERIEKVSFQYRISNVVYLREGKLPLIRERRKEKRLQRNRRHRNTKRFYFSLDLIFFIMYVMKG